MPTATDDHLIVTGAPLALEAAADAGAAPRVTGTAYSGGPMSVARVGKVAIDLASLELPDRVPLLADHKADVGSVIGHATARVEGGRLTIEGTLSGTGPAAQQIRESAANGFRWRASVGVKGFALRRVGNGETALVNGQAVTGPLSITEGGRLYEVSVLALAADDTTELTISAAFHGGTNMSDEQPSLTYDDGQAAERERVAAIRRDCRRLEFPSLRARFEKIEGDAIEGGWDLARTREALMNVVSREMPAAPSQPTSLSGVGDLQPRAIEAALARSAGVSAETLEREYKPNVLEAADAIGHVGLVEALELAARHDGVNLPRRGSSPSESWIRAAASGVSLPGVLGNTLNKLLLDSFRRAGMVATTIARVRSVNDFKSRNAYRLTNSMEFEEVGADGNFTTGNMVETSRSNQASVYGKLIELSYQTIRNDDLGAFSMIPQALGQGAAQKLEKVVMTLLISNPNVTDRVAGADGEPSETTAAFFSDTWSNLQEGSDDALTLAGGVEAISEAAQKMKLQRDCWGEPIVARPRFLLVPPELGIIANQIVRSELLAASGSTDRTSVPTSNPYFGALDVLESPYLSLSTITGSSTTAWYLLSDPSILEAVELVFVDGVTAPQVETFSLSENPHKLCYTWRAHMDFGAALMEPRAIVKVTGVDASS